MSRCVEIGDIHLGGGGEGADLVFLAADQRGHGSWGGQAGFFHEGPAFADDAKPVFKREGSSGGMGGEFAQRESRSGDGGEPRKPLANQRERHQTVKIERGLAARGFCEFLVGAFEHHL